MVINQVTIIIAVTVVLFFVTERNYALKDNMLFAPYRIKHNQEYYRMISGAFIHQDITHLLFNMLSLYLLGSYLEEALVFTMGVAKGELTFFILYIFGALFAELFPYIRHQDNDLYRSLGASGAVCAVLFAMIVWDPNQHLQPILFPVAIPAFIFGPLYLAIEYYAMRRGNTSVAHDAHIGGAVFGILFILMIFPSKGNEFIQAIITQWQQLFT